ncbi:MAG: hypothetical protein H6598_08805 [Flavobacteriales bacterium]|nr:hypothetical protein [Flavobacteriales bacterium]
MKVLFSTLFLTSLFLFSFSTNKNTIPDGWFAAGSQPKDYYMGRDLETFRNGKQSATIRSTKTKIKGFGTLMQTCDADDFLNKRIKFSGYMKSENVTEWAGFWFRIDGKPGEKSLGFDNMGDRPIVGTTDWHYYEIILDVPKESLTLNYGALLSGTGQIWFDDIKIEIIDKDTPTTGCDRLAQPKNLDFEN